MPKSWHKKIPKKSHLNRWTRQTKLILSIFVRFCAEFSRSSYAVFSESHCRPRNDFLNNFHFFGQKNMFICWNNPGYYQEYFDFFQFARDSSGNYPRNIAENLISALYSFPKQLPLGDQYNLEIMFFFAKCGQIESAQ